MEHWRAVGGWEGWYEVSDLGRVRSLTRVSTAGRKKNAIYKGKVLKASPAKNGYPCVVLSRPDEMKRKNVHSLVLESFTGPRLPGTEGMHKDGSRDNNRLKNLKYGTCSENQKDRIKHGRGPTGEKIRGENNRNAKLTVKAVRYIRARPGAIIRVLAEKFGVSESVVWCVRNKRTWRHV